MPQFDLAEAALSGFTQVFTISVSEQGPQGPQGPVGPSGESNSSFHPDSPGASLPTTSNLVGELFTKIVVGVKAGTYASLDLVGNWTGPIS